jgi:hypothetical protein
MEKFGIIPCSPIRWTFRGTVAERGRATARLVLHARGLQLGAVGLGRAGPPSPSHPRVVGGGCGGAAARKGTRSAEFPGAIADRLDDLYRLVAGGGLAPALTQQFEPTDPRRAFSVL